MVTRLSKTRIHTDTSVAFQGPVNYAAASGTDTYTADPSPAFTAYVVGAHYFISFTNANTSTTPTLNLNYLGAKTIVKEGTSALSAGDIPAGHKGILMYDGTYLTLLNPKVNITMGTPSFLAYRSTNQTISTSTFTKVQLTSESWDTNSCFDSVTNYRFTPTTAGKYQLVASIVAACAATYKFAAVLYKNGVYHRAGVDMSPGITDNFGGSCAWLVDANGSTDYFELYVFQNSGVSKDIVGNGEANIVFGGFRAY